MLARSIRLIAAVAGLVVLFGVGGFTRPESALAADPSAPPVDPHELGLGVGPSQLVLGEGQRSGSFTVYNAGKVEVKVTSSTFDFIIDASGKRVPSTEPIPVGASRWITTTPASFTFQAGETQIVTFTLAIPEGATPGDHYAAVAVTGTISDAEWQKRIDAAASGQSGSALVRSQVAFAITLVVRVAGAIDNALAVQLDVPSPLFTMSGDYTFSPAIVDSGNVAAIWMPAADNKAAPETIVPTLHLTNAISVLGGDALLYLQNRDGTPASVTVLPGTTKRQELVLRDVPIVGSYDYTYNLPAIAADGRADITVTGHFWIVNLQKVFIWIVLPILVLILLLVLLIVRKRQNKRMRQRIKEEAVREYLASTVQDGGAPQGRGQNTPSGPQNGPTQ